MTVNSKQVIDKYKLRLKQLEDGAKEVYEGEADIIRQIISNSIVKGE